MSGSQYLLPETQLLKKDIIVNHKKMSMLKRFVYVILITPIVFLSIIIGIIRFIIYGGEDQIFYFANYVERKFKI